MDNFDPCNVLFCYCYNIPVLLKTSLSLRRAHGPLAKVWCIWHTYLETLQQCQSRRRIGWIIQDFRETCVLEHSAWKKDAVAPNPLTKEESRGVYKCDMNAYQGQLKAGFSKVCEIFKVRGIESLKYIREFHAPKRDAKWNELWLVVCYVSQTASWAGLGQWKLPSIPDLQPSVWRSGYARLTQDWLCGPGSYNCVRRKKKNFCFVNQVAVKDVMKKHDMEYLTIASHVHSSQSLFSFNHRLFNRQLILKLSIF